MNEKNLGKNFGYCPKCGNHSIGIKFSQKKRKKDKYYCPCCDWESEFIEEAKVNRKEKQEGL